MLVALPCFYSQVATQYYSVIAGGLGFHEWQNSTSTNQNAIKSMTVMQYPYALTLTLVRLSICVLLRRIFIQKWLRVCSMLAFLPRIPIHCPMPI
ncbi:hypothetical protein EV356DRAFT_39400 [Viridothelium virens]|uniref:Rhodopsin domain-containing protein n=1 Tax=Viridothelium virens TaxID=1048519 RepID=A0A6A6HGK5_VIRVR|nr:hypothetical protein EV356DRAFT_39400 [Viridothelium virens]